MIGFTPEEQMVVLLYSPGTRPGLIAELTAMKQQLTPREKIGRTDEKRDHYQQE